MTSEGAESPISYGEEESIRSSSAPVDHSIHGAAPDVSVTINSEPAAVYPTVPVSSDSCVAAAADVMTDIDIIAEPDSHPNKSRLPNINTPEVTSEMMMNRSQSHEMETTANVPTTTANLEDDAAAGCDREGPRTIGGVECPAPRTFDSVGNDDFKTISTISWFSLRAVLSVAFERLEEYAWEGQLFWGEDAACVRSRVWRGVFATDPGDLNARGSHGDKLVEFVKHVQRGLAALAPTSLI